MSRILFYRDFTDNNQFKIDYPYYGLFGTAEVTVINENDGIAYHCKLLNGAIVIIKKRPQQSKWIDTELDCVTPLSSTLGIAIEDFLNTN